MVTPAFNESKNLPLLYERLKKVLGKLGLAWEWVVIDDHSCDETFDVLRGLARRDARVRGLRLARNSGSHVAITCGLQHARGDCAVLMAADLQDPPEVVPTLLEPWRAGAQVVWAVRNRREGQSAGALGFARLYYWIMRRVVGMREMPATGADFFLMDRHALDAFRQFGEGNTSVLALVTWMGFRQATVGYDKQPRVHGQSGWSLARKLKLVVDSVTSFSSLPIRAMSYAGLAVALLGVIGVALALATQVRGQAVDGWIWLAALMLAVGGVQMLMLGVLGEYLWRALDESRRRPRYLIEEATPSQTSDE